MITLELPWPNSKLSPNSRTHWRAKARYQQWAHLFGYAAANEWLGKHRAPNGGPRGPLPVKLVFCPPDKRPRDLDNLGASCKWALDGVARALQVDDKQFRPLTLDWGEPRKGGCVKVEIGL